MSELIKFEVKPFAAARVIGKLVDCSLNEGADNPVPGMWESMGQDGRLDFLKNMHERATPDPDMVGWLGGYNPESNSFTYIIGVLTRPDTPVPDGYAYRDIPDCEIGIAWIQGSDDNGDIYQGAHDINAKAMQESGYEYDHSAGGFEMEYYSHARFAIPATNGEKTLVMEYYSPCRKKQ